MKTNTSEPHQHASGMIGLNVWHLIRHLWCRHRWTVTVEKTDDMPAHLVCQSCGWREPVLPAVPQGTRTWDSTRDEARYLREKKRRAAAEQQKQVAVALRATPGSRPGSARRTRRSNIVEMRRVAGE